MRADVPQPCLRGPRRAGRPIFRRSGMGLCRLALVLALAAGGCDGGGRGSPARATTAPAAARPTVASLVPAATDILLGMGAGDHLVAVSNFDVARDPVRGLPKVGDYETVDWERVATLRPELMVTQFAEGRVPEGLRQREKDLGIRPVNVRINNLADIFAAYDVLGEAVHERDKASRAAGALRERLERLRLQTQGLPKVSVLIATDPTGLHLAGPGTFLDDLLPYAGATNAAAALKQEYPAIDREMLRALDPDVIVQLLPGEPPQVVEQARRAGGTCRI